MCHLHGKSVILFAWSYHYFDIHNYILFSFGATPYGILPRSQITILFWLFLTSYMQLDRRIFQIHSKNYVPRKFKISNILKRKEYLRVVHIYPATSLVETSIWSIVSAPLDQHSNWSFHNLHGGFFIPTGIFLPQPSGKGISERYKWYTASYRSNSNSKPKSPIQTVTSGISWYKLFIPLR
jgi:hypothetical protein